MGVKEMARKIRGRNEGSLHQRSNGTWRAQILLNGKRISFGAKTKADCQEWLRRFQHELDRGYDYHEGMITLSNYLEQWLESSKSSLRIKTVYQYSQIIDKYIAPHLGSVKINELRIVNIEHFYSTLIQNNTGIRTIRIAHAILHRALEKAVRYGLINRNPAHGAALPKYKQAEMQILDEGQVGRLLIATQGSPYQALYHLAITSGMRQGELFGLKWADLQWGSGTLHIQRQVQKVPGVGWSFVEPKTRSGRRTIKLGEGTLQVLREHKERQALMIALAGDRWKENDLIFPTSVGTPGDRSNLRADFRKILKSTGLPLIRFHDLRHTAASLLLNHGVPVIVV